MRAARRAPPRSPRTGSAKSEWESFTIRARAASPFALSGGVPRGLGVEGHAEASGRCARSTRTGAPPRRTRRGTRTDRRPARRRWARRGRRGRARARARPRAGRPPPARSRGAGRCARPGWPGTRAGARRRRRAGESDGQEASESVPSASGMPAARSASRRGSCPPMKRFERGQRTTVAPERAAARGRRRRGRRSGRRGGAARGAGRPARRRSAPCGTSSARPPAHPRDEVPEAARAGGDEGALRRILREVDRARAGAEQLDEARVVGRVDGVRARHDAEPRRGRGRRVAASPSPAASASAIRRGVSPNTSWKTVPARPGGAERRERARACSTRRPPPRRRSGRGPPRPSSWPGPGRGRAARARAETNSSIQAGSPSPPATRRPGATARGAGGRSRARGGAPRRAARPSRGAPRPPRAGRPRRSRSPSSATAPSRIAAPPRPASTHGALTTRSHHGPFPLSPSACGLRSLRSARAESKGPAARTSCCGATGRKPASRMWRSTSSASIWKVVPAAETTFSSIIT